MAAQSHRRYFGSVRVPQRSAPRTLLLRHLRGTAGRLPRVHADWVPGRRRDDLAQQQDQDWAPLSAQAPAQRDGAQVAQTRAGMLVLRFFLTAVTAVSLLGASPHPSDALHWR